VAKRPTRSPELAPDHALEDEANSQADPNRMRPTKSTDEKQMKKGSSRPLSIPPELLFSP
jgi:hypothetical protein